MDATCKLCGYKVWETTQPHEKHCAAATEALSYVAEGLYPCDRKHFPVLQGLKVPHKSTLYALYAPRYVAVVLACINKAHNQHDCIRALARNPELADAVIALAAMLGPKDKAVKELLMRNRLIEAFPHKAQSGDD